MSGKNVLIDCRSIFLLAEDHARSWTAQRLVGGGGHKLRVRDWGGMYSTGNEPGEMGHVDQQKRSAGVGNGAHALKIKDTRIGAASPDNQLRLLAHGDLLEIVIVDCLCVLPYAVRHNSVELAREIQLVSVGQMTAMRQIKSQNGIPRLKHRRVRSRVGL